jgi:hypothetical protein
VYKSKGARLRRRAIACAALASLAISAFLAIDRKSGAAAPVKANAAFVLPFREAIRQVPHDLLPLVRRLHNRAARAVSSSKTSLGKALALERVVHTAVRRTGATCAGYATVMEALGVELGLPVRIVSVAASPSGFDSHTTVSTWLASYHRWGIVDPTFGGTFTRGDDRRPLGAVDLQHSLIGNWWRQVRWHPSAPDSKPLSSYYVNPLFLFRYIGVVGYVEGSVTTVALPYAAGLASSTLAISPRAVARTNPNLAVKVRRLPQAPMTVTLPPAYAPWQIWQRRIRSRSAVAVPRGSIVVWSSSPRARIAGYPTFSADGGSLSPIFISDGTIRLSGTGETTVRIYRARRFNNS